MSITTREDVARLVDAIRDARRDLHRWPSPPPGDHVLRRQVDDLYRRLYAAEAAATLFLDADTPDDTRQAMLTITAMLRPIPLDPSRNHR